MLQACLNGSRRPGEHPRLPCTARDLAADAAAVVAAGVRSLHVHPKDPEGADSLDPGHVAAAVAALRAAAPGVEVSVTTGAWAATGAARRELVRSWAPGTLPDLASVNWHEEGAEDLARLLLERGVGVEAGLWSPAAAGAWCASPLAEHCARVLLEVQPGPGGAAAVRAAEELLDAVGERAAGRVLLHGEGSACWPVLHRARELGLATRVGLEDTLVLPDGTPAPGNRALVEAAGAVPAGVDELHDACHGEHDGGEPGSRRYGPRGHGTHARERGTGQ
ncbi:3-keto-5-aminohexanoate cleavage protein [Kineococcus sp. NUM-3379]